LRRAAERFDVAIVGGETSGTDGPLTVSVSVVGCVEKNRWVSRSGGKSGDHLFVTGKLGGSGRGRHLQFVARIREARWLTRHFRIHAMMDLSDGLGADLPRLARASGVGYEIDLNALPRNRGCSLDDALSEGEDYELLFAVPSPDRDRLEASWVRKFPNLPLTRIGSLSQSPKIRYPRLKSGYIHFQQSR
jgi:thiamine-monophosphate kinase